MTESDKAKEAKARLEQARKDAQDAQPANTTSPKSEMPARGNDSQPGDKQKAGATSDSSAPAAKPADTKSTDAKPADAKRLEGTEPPRPASPNTAATAAAATASSVATPPKPGIATENTAHYDDEHEGDDVDAHEDGNGRSLPGLVLQWLAILVVGAAVALWAGPKIAPHLPGWAAPAAKFLTPGANQSDEAIAALSAATETQIAALEEKITALQAALDSGIEGVSAAAESDLADTRMRLEQQIAEVGATLVVDENALRKEIDAIAGRASSAEAMLEGLRAEINALSGLSPSDAAPSAETLERVAAFGAAVEGLRSEVAALSTKTARIDALATTEALAALNDRVKALEGGEAATDRAAREAEAIRTAARVDAALAHIDQALQSGTPFTAALTDASSLLETPPPPALAALAETGAPTTGALLRQFGEAAKLGYAAAQTADAGEGFGARFLAGIEGRLGGRPSVETAGDDAGAVLSRIEARLKEGRIAAAHAEVSGLPEPAASAMQPWLNDLAAAHAAAAALADWHTALRAN